jgi:sulfhydrogenase subunit beta (sulfur reductase)
MALRVMQKEALSTLVDALIGEQKVVGPKRVRDHFAFDEIKSSDELALDYSTTILPPKGWLLPPEEAIVSFSLGEQPQVEPKIEAEPVVLLGVHPCDIAGIACLDEAMTEGNVDPNYAARREQMTIVGTECSPDEYCYCTFVGTATAESGYDVFLTDIGDAFVVDIATDKGKALMSSADTAPADAEQLAKMKEVQAKKAEQVKCDLDADIRLLPLVMTKATGSDLWEKHAALCFKCGSCNMVCPTCYCFDVADQVSPDLQSGMRVRTWDGCMLDPFAAVASGENFRERKEDRLFHRISRKFHYQYTKFGRPHCTGCGRCVRACVAGINQFEVISDLLAEQAEGVTHGS